MIDSDLKLVLAVLLAVVGLLCATVVACVAIGAYTDYQCIKAGCPREVCGQAITIGLRSAKQADSAASGTDFPRKEPSEACN